VYLSACWGTVMHSHGVGGPATRAASQGCSQGAASAHKHLAILSAPRQHLTPRRHPDSDVRDSAALYADLAVMLPPPRLRAALAGPGPADAGPADAACGGAALEPGLGLTLGHAPRALCPAPAPPAAGVERALLAACAARPGPAAGSQTLGGPPAARPAAVSAPAHTGRASNGEHEKDLAKAPSIARAGDGAAAGGGAGVLSEYLAHVAALEAPSVVIWLQLSISVAAPAAAPAPAGSPQDGPAPPSHAATRVEDKPQQPGGRAAAASPAGPDAAGAGSPAAAGGAAAPGPGSREGGADARHALYGVEITFTSCAAHGRALVTQDSSEASHSAALEAAREAGGEAAAAAWLDHAGNWARQQARGRWARIGAVRMPRLAAGDAGAPVPMTLPCPMEPCHGANGARCASGPPTARLLAPSSLQHRSMAPPRRGVAWRRSEPRHRRPLYCAVTHRACPHAAPAAARTLSMRPQAA
jgi:hypothetical protein